ncbi:MAG: TIGR04282 family arsenosugar biosynthesis glycosyltransferase [Jatrophihabitantaceae bacterium]
MTTLIVLAKRPAAGRVKTRLTPPLSPCAAAQVAGAALRDTLRAVALTPATRRILAFDADPAGWLPRGWDRSRQPAGGLDERLVAAIGGSGRTPALLVGMDTPQLRPQWLSEFDPSRYDACLGLATDGGYWAIGLRDPRHAGALIRGVPMSLPTTGAEQLRRLLAAGMRVQLLREATDVDTIDTAWAVASEIPDSEFAANLYRVTAATDPAIDGAAS